MCSRPRRTTPAGALLRRSRAAAGWSRWSEATATTRRPTRPEFSPSPGKCGRPRSDARSAGADRWGRTPGRRAPETRLRHYDRLEQFPDGVVAVGDAVSAFNPVYGQGMTVAALGVEVLEHWL